LRISADENKKLNTKEFRELWREIAWDYSDYDLTFLSDKLIVLSGVAKYTEQLLHIEYCAGLWRIDLVRGLLWYVTISIPLDSITYRAL
jgi:hypothetical protein